jgi:hypothetical protein
MRVSYLRRANGRKDDLPLDEYCRHMRREIDFMVENPTVKADTWDVYLIDQKTGKAFRPVDPHAAHGAAGHDAHAAPKVDDMTYPIKPH